MKKALLQVRVLPHDFSMPRQIPANDLRRTKLSQSDIDKIFTLRFPQNGSEPMSCPQLARRFGVTSKTVSDLLKRYAHEHAIGGAQ